MSQTLSVFLGVLNAEKRKPPLYHGVALESLDWSELELSLLAGAREHLVGEGNCV